MNHILYRKLILSLLLAIFFSYCHAQYETPRQLYGDLFINVQMQSVFLDQKTFVDCIPKSDPDSIVKQYNAEKELQDFSLGKYVTDHFTLPDTQTIAYSSNIKAGVVNHVNELWKILSRQPTSHPDSFSSLLPLPNPYIIPGGRFREIYYWDSYFTILGLQKSRDTVMIDNMVQNFAYLINTFGFVPNGNRTYYLTRSQPPFFSLMVDLLADLKGNEVYKIYLSALLKEYSFWMRGTDKLITGAAKMNVVNINGSILNRYWDESDQPREESFKQDVEASKTSEQIPEEFYRNIRAAAESGWDFSSRWFSDEQHLSTIRTTEVIPVDLNCLLYQLESTIAISYHISSDSTMAALYKEKATIRKNAILKYCWNESGGFFSDYLFKEQKTSDAITLAGMFPLFFQIATSQQAVREKRIVNKKLLRSGGVVTTLENTGQQWDAPNGWAPLEYMTVEGLNHYGFDKLAEKIALRWIHLNTVVFDQTGKLTEKYNVENINLEGGGGEYPLQDGFGWTNGVLITLMNQYKIK